MCITTTITIIIIIIIIMSCCIIIITLTHTGRASGAASSNPGAPSLPSEGGKTCRLVVLVNNMCIYRYYIYIYIFIYIYIYIPSSSQKHPDVFVVTVSIGETAAVLYLPETINKNNQRWKP